MARIRELNAERRTPEEIRADLEATTTNPKGAPGVRTIQRIVADLRDLSGPWTLADADADPDAAALIVPVIAALVARSAGRRRQITKEEALWVARIRRAAPGIDAFMSYNLAREYMHAPETAATLDAFLGFAPWSDPEARSRYAAEWIDKPFAWIRYSNEERMVDVRERVREMTTTPQSVKRRRGGRGGKR